MFGDLPLPRLNNCRFAADQKHIAKVWGLAGAMAGVALRR
jgi:hypothetical protein